MNSRDIEQSDTPKTTPADAGKSRKPFVKIVLPAAILCAGALVALSLEKSAPEAHRRPPASVTALVETMTVEHTTEQIRVPAMGTVIPAREVVVEARVTGHVVGINPAFVAGGYLKKGEEILKIDDRDYRLILAQKKSALTSALSALKLEMGRQDVAKGEWEILTGGKKTGGIDTELALRKPQLADAEAAVASAEAALRQAELDCARTAVTAPFNCLIREKYADIGSHLSSQDQIAEIVGIDEYRIQASVPVDRLRWITFPQDTDDSGSKTLIIVGSDASALSEKTGRVVTLLGDLDEKGRMARILVSVPDPLNMNTHGDTRPLLIGEYVHLKIEGPTLDDVVRLPRRALRDGENVWIFTDDSTLAVTPVEIVWRDDDSVLVRDGLTDGDRVIVSNLSSPVPGMKLSTDSRGSREKTAYSPPDGSKGN